MKGGDPMDFEVFVTPGLGDNSYLVRSGDEAVIVDPQRDAWRFLAAAERLGVYVRAVLETHVHNDYVSGAHEIRAATGATLVLPAQGRYEFAHQGAEDGYELAIGDLRLVAMATPGHTPAHLSWLWRRPCAPRGRPGVGPPTRRARRRPRGAPKRPAGRAGCAPWSPEGGPAREEARIRRGSCYE